MPALDLHPVIHGTRFTLRGIFRTSALAEGAIERLVADGFVADQIEVGAPTGKTLHHVAARHQVQPALRAGIPQEHSADWEATRMAVQVFRGVARASRGPTTSLRWYKALDVPALHATIRAYPWTGTHLDVASRILSSTVVKHPFPNANHRTSISLMRLYLASVGIPWPHYTLRGGGKARFYRDGKPYLIESKYLLQLVRHRPLMRLAHEEGYTHLRIGDDAQAEIRAADLAKNGDQLRAAHLDRTRRYILGLAQAAGAERLDESNRQGLKGWVSWYMVAR